ncbi:MAG: peptidoglycan-associated lipoprotein Pal [Thermodesulfobacteriota bacterium]|jgi:peptidoglycan-associated lipoprotein|nr:peptidoglycan-associated lipoprotein Pal [Thermodesulfobacteriota bacterium]
MKIKQRMRLTVLLVMAAFLVFAGCAKKPATEGYDDYSKPVEETRLSDEELAGYQDGDISESAVAEEMREDERFRDGYGEDASEALQRIFFEFDQYTLSAEARRTLADNAEYLKENPQIKVLIEGHCDERGSDEYNLALGEKRAQAVKNYLVSLGVEPGRLSVISYGEELPLDPGRGEEAWSRNRRAEFKPVE